MRTHLIYRLDSFGVWENNYETFISKRSNRILKMTIFIEDFGS